MSELTVKEAAAELQVTLQAIRQFLREGKLKFRKEKVGKGKPYRIDRASFDQLVSERNEKATPPEGYYSTEEVAKQLGFVKNYTYHLLQKKKLPFLRGWGGAKYYRKEDIVALRGEARRRPGRPRKAGQEQNPC